MKRVDGRVGREIELPGVTNQWTQTLNELLIWSLWFWRRKKLKFFFSINMQSPSCPSKLVSIFYHRAFSFPPPCFMPTFFSPVFFFFIFVLCVKKNEKESEGCLSLDWNVHVEILLLFSSTSTLGSIWFHAFQPIAFMHLIESHFSSSPLKRINDVCRSHFNFFAKSPSDDL